MQKIDDLRKKIFVIIIFFSFCISIIYRLILPVFFMGVATYIFIIGGVILAMLFSGYLSYKYYADRVNESKYSKIFLYSIITAALVTFLSLFIMLNTVKP